MQRALARHPQQRGALFVAERAGDAQGGVEPVDAFAFLAVVADGVTVADAKQSPKERIATSGRMNLRSSRPAGVRPRDRP